MTRCDLQASGAVELYFYGELEAAERGRLERHLKTCGECRAALDELATIRAVLASRPDIAAPPGGDWSGFMTRLEASVRRGARPGDGPAGGRVVALPPGGRLVPYLAMAALLALVTIGVLLVVNERTDPGGRADVPLASEALVPPPPPDREADAALALLGEQHFERSKLVVLGLATRDPERTDAADWAYERQLASTLLDDTRLYRQSAEQHGMGALAGVMRDLELVLLQASMSTEADAESLEQLQRLIRRRDLITKMTVVRTAGLAP
jgi:hypothetical protein